MTPTRVNRVRQVAVIAAAAAAILAPFLVYVWGNVQIVSRGYQIAATEARIHELEQENRALRLAKARLEASGRIEERARKLGFEHLPPSRILTLSDRRLAAPRAAPPLPTPTPAASPAGQDAR